MKPATALALAALLFVIGLVGGRLTAPTVPSAERDTVARDAGGSTGGDAPGADLASPSFRDPAGDPDDPDDGAEGGGRVAAQPEGPSGGPLFSPALLAHARQGIRDGWAQVRRDAPADSVVEEGVAAFEERTLALPVAIGADLARRRTAAEKAAEDARTGGAFAILDRLMEGGAGPLPEIVEAKATFDGLFQTESQGPTLGAASVLGEREPPDDGTTVTFPAGVFEVGDFGRLWGEDYPGDLTLRGAGKDATLLVLRSNWSARGRVRNLTIQGLTIHANNNYLFDVREPSMSLTIRRCRLTGWTTGAGASCLFGTEGLALRVEDSEITGAYCRLPAYGQMFDVRHPGLLARFENCTIEAMRPFGGITQGATVAFVGCTIRSAVGRNNEVPTGVTLPGTNVEWFAGDDPNALARDLDELFPDWESRMER